MRRNFLALIVFISIFVNPLVVTAFGWTWDPPVVYKSHLFHNGDELISVVIDVRTDRVIGYLYPPALMINFAERTATIYARIGHSSCNYEFHDGYVVSVHYKNGGFISSKTYNGYEVLFSLPDLPPCGHIEVKAYICDEDGGTFYSVVRKLYYRNKESKNN